MRNIPSKENRFSILSKVLIIIFIFTALGPAFLNILRGVVVTPNAFVVVIFGLFLFLIAKISVISKGNLISFGTKKMSNTQANIYRLGYWFMAVSILFTFL